jgi:sugar lactone lactonase YvrE
MIALRMKPSRTFFAAIILPAIFLQSCATPKQETKAAEPAPPPSMKAELLGSDKTWGNTEGPATDSKGTLYFTSRGTYKGIMSWNEKQGFRPYLAVATGEGPGGLWIDDADNILVTATHERKILKISPDKKVKVVAEKFEADAKLAKGPNDLLSLKNGTIYFTDPNGYDGSAPNGTVYMIRNGKTSILSAEVTGPNGIGLSADEKTLYVSHSISADTARIVRWSLNEDGTAGPISVLATIKPCVADGIDLDREGAFWLTCYSHGTAYRIGPDGKTLSTITTEQKALTNMKFGRAAAGSANVLFLTSSDMDRVTGYIYKATVPVPGRL